MATIEEHTHRWPGIREFYADKEVFITGVTGFMGKCLLEKILRSLPEVRRVLVLVRPKKGRSAKERIEDLFTCKVFEAVRTESPGVLGKVQAVAGDVSQPGLGLSEEDRRLLVEEAQVVFHLAATVRFDEPLKCALEMNVMGVREVCRLCKDMKKLVSFVHMSTAYVYCNKLGAHFEETIYPMQSSPNNLLSITEWMNDEQLNALTPTLLEGRPNTYTFTKALGEHLLVKEAKGLPVAIFRPSIVGAAYQEPLPGWIDTIQGPGGIFVAVGKGLIRVMRASEHAIADFVPVDYANNTLLCIAWVTAQQGGVAPSPSARQPIIYHCTSGSLNPMRWIRLYALVTSSYARYPFEQVFRRPWVMKARPASSWPLYNFVLHMIPGFFADVLLRMLGKKPIISRVYNKIGRALDHLSFFIMNEWTWSYRNTDRLLSLMSAEEKKTFYFDIRDLNWDTYVTNFCIGTKCYLMKEDLANLPSARRHIKRLRNTRYTFNFVMFLLATRLLYVKSKFARQVWGKVVGFLLKWLSKFGLPLLH